MASKCADYQVRFKINDVRPDQRANCFLIYVAYVRPVQLIVFC